MNKASVGIHLILINIDIYIHSPTHSCTGVNIIPSTDYRLQSRWDGIG